MSDKDQEVQGQECEVKYLNKSNLAFKNEVLNDLQEDSETSSENFSMIFNELPSRVMSCVITFLNSNDRIKLRLVSMRWKNYMDKHVGVKINYGYASVFTPRKLSINYEPKFCPPEIASQIGISSIYFSNMRLSKLPTFKYPNLIKKLSFIDNLTQLKLLKLLQDLKNLRHLKLDISSMLYLDFSDMSQMGCLHDKLEILEMTNSTYSNDNRYTGKPTILQQNVLITLGNICSLLSSTLFSALKNLKINYPSVYPLYLNYLFFESVVKFLSNHHKTITSLELSLLEGRFITEYLELFDDEDDEINLIDIHFSPPPPELINNFKNLDWSEVKKSNLSHVSILYMPSDFLDSPLYNEDLNLVTFWQNFFGNLSNAQYVSLKSIERTQNTIDNYESCFIQLELPLPEQMLVKNSSSLTSLKWNIRYNGGVVDCACLKNLKILKELYIASSRDFVNGNVEISGVKNFPLTLTRLHLRMIPLASSDIENIYKNLKFLDTLQLEKVTSRNAIEGWRNVEIHAAAQQDLVPRGMTLVTFHSIIEEKRLKLLVLNLGVNIENFRELEPQYTEKMTSILSQLMSRMNDMDYYMCLKLNGEKNYEIGDIYEISQDF